MSEIKLCRFANAVEKLYCTFAAMPRRGLYKTICRQLILLGFLIFASSPCSVKEVLLSTANSEYARPLSKTKATVPGGYCVYFPGDLLQTSAVSKSKAKSQDPLSDFVFNQSFEVFSPTVYNRYSNIFSGNSPPRYILYKRLKIYTA